MARWKISSSRNIPDELRKLGLATSIIIECDAVRIPLKDQREQGDTTAFFNGFPIELLDGDTVERISE